MESDHVDQSTVERYRKRLFGLAYRMLSSAAEAEDIVQETFLRWHQADKRSIRNAEGWLVSVATRLSIDRLRAFSRTRKDYAGPWLPEPLVSELPPPDRNVEIRSDLSVAFLVLLERLGAEERAAFLLHEVFDVGYDETAEVLGKSETACRQMVHRARQRVRSEQKRFTATPADRVTLLRKFTTALEARNEKALLALFAADATWTADGGGRTPAAPRPIVGADRVVKLVLGLQRTFERKGAIIELVGVNDEAGLRISLDGTTTAVLAVKTDGARILDVYVVVNPQKLKSRIAPI